MKKYLAPALLCLLSAFMLLGFLRADIAPSAATIIAFLLTVLLPAGIATRLLLNRTNTLKVQERQDSLRMRTIEAEILRIAQLNQGKLTIVEMVSQLAVTPDEAKRAADSLARQELADIEITESGVLVYAFRDVRLLHEKPSARGLLE